MIGDTSHVNVYLAPGTTDMRKSIDGLALMVSETLCLDPFSESLFVFCNRGRDKLKILHWADQRFLALLPAAGEGPVQLADTGAEYKSHHA